MNLPLVALYVGPDQVMPVMSILATILGFLLVFWNRVVSLLRKFTGLFKRSSATPAGGSTPSSPTGEPPKQG